MHSTKNTASHTPKQNLIKVDWPLKAFQRSLEFRLHAAYCVPSVITAMMLCVWIIKVDSPGLHMSVTMVVFFHWFYRSQTVISLLQHRLVDILHLKSLIHLEEICVYFHESILSGLLWLLSRYRWRSVHPVVVSLQPPAGHLSPLALFPLTTGHKSEHPARKGCHSLTHHLLTDLASRGTQDTCATGV